MSSPRGEEDDLQQRHQRENQEETATPALSDADRVGAVAVRNPSPSAAAGDVKDQYRSSRNGINVTAMRRSQPAPNKGLTFEQEDEKQNDSQHFLTDNDDSEMLQAEEIIRARVAGNDFISNQSRAVAGANSQQQQARARREAEKLKQEEFNPNRSAEPTLDANNNTVPAPPAIDRGVSRHGMMEDSSPTTEEVTRGAPTPAPHRDSLFEHAAMLSALTSRSTTTFLQSEEAPAISATDNDRAANTAGVLAPPVGAAAAATTVPPASSEEGDQEQEDPAADPSQNSASEYDDMIVGDAEVSSVFALNRMASSQLPPNADGFVFHAELVQSSEFLAPAMEGDEDSTEEENSDVFAAARRRRQENDLEQAAAAPIAVATEYVPREPRPKPTFWQLHSKMVIVVGSLVCCAVIAIIAIVVAVVVTNSDDGGNEDTMGSPTTPQQGSPTRSVPTVPPVTSSPLAPTQSPSSLPSTSMSPSASNSPSSLPSMSPTNKPSVSVQPTFTPFIVNRQGTDSSPQELMFVINKIDLDWCDHQYNYAVPCGGNLASVTSSLEEDYIDDLNLLANDREFRPLWTGGIQLNISNTVGGAASFAVEGPWTWLDGTEFRQEYLPKHESDIQYNLLFTFPNGTTVGEHYLMRSIYEGTYSDVVGCTASPLDEMRAGLLLLPLNWRENPDCLAVSNNFIYSLDQEV